MDFELSSEQADLRDAAIQVLGAHASHEQLRSFVGLEEPVPREGAFDADLWQAMSDQGWLALEQPVDEDGLGLGTVELSLLCEELGRRVAPAPFVGSVLVQGALREASDEPSLAPEVRDWSRSWLGRLASGEVAGCLAWAGSGAEAGGLGESPASPSSEGDCLLSARPEPTVFAPAADVAVVLVGDAVYALTLADRRRPSAEPAMDRTRSIGWLRLDRTPAFRIGGPIAARRLLDRAVTALSAELLGASSRALDMAVEYAKDRVQFGKPIGSFQAVKHRLADALVDVEGMRSSVYYAAWSVSEDQPDASLAASAAKAWSSDASRRVMATALQVHGGIGFTWEHDLHLYVKRAQLDAMSWGDASYHRERIAGLLSNRLPSDPDLF